MWHALEPSDGVYNFTLLDAIIDGADTVGLSVMLGTPTATMPSWLYSAHPEVANVMPDSEAGHAGAVAGFGGRRQYSFNSPLYLDYASRIVSKLVGRYGHRKAVSFWQVDNELGHEGSELDFSGNALPAWRRWLADRFDNDISALNAAWGTVFWGVTYGSFAQVPLPRFTVPGVPDGSRPNANFRANHSPGMLLDYRRFCAASVATFANRQVSLIRNGTTQGAMITTNSPGGVWAKALDSNAIFASMDVAGYDNYP
eukprot:4845826-Prymnesium_polylepis.1